MRETIAVELPRDYITNNRSDYSGTAVGFPPECWSPSDRNAGRHRAGTAVGFARNTQWWSEPPFGLDTPYGLNGGEIRWYGKRLNRTFYDQAYIFKKQEIFFQLNRKGAASWQTCDSPLSIKPALGYREVKTCQKM
jgi:hypothetical protein